MANAAKNTSMLPSEIDKLKDISGDRSESNIRFGHALITTLECIL